jgi:hypothetical protein
MFMFDGMGIEQAMGHNVLLLVGGMEARTPCTSDMLLGDLARHIFVMSDDKAKVEDAYRPIYKWEHGTMRAKQHGNNLPGASQKLEANTFDELRGLEGVQSGKTEEEEFASGADLLLSEEAKPTPATASKKPTPATASKLDKK